MLTFFKVKFFRISFRNTIRVSNCLDPDQDRRSVGPYLDPNCLQRLSADGDFCHLVIALTNSLNPDQDGQTVCPGLDPNR